MVKKILNLPTNDSKIYKQLLAFLNFSLDATPQEREVLAEIIKLNNDYEALPPKQRAKWLLSTDMRKEMREALDIEEKHFNVLISRLRKKTIFGEAVFDDDGVLNRHLILKPDSEGIQIEINLVNTNATIVDDRVEESIDEIQETENEPKKEKLAEPANNAPIISSGDENDEFELVLSNNE